MDRDNEALGRRIAEQAAASGQSQESSDEDDTYAVREGVTRAIDPDEIELRHDRAVVEDDNAARVQADIAGFDADRELARPPAFPESLDVTSIAPDGSAIGGSKLTSPTGDPIGGGGLLADIQSRAGALGGDALSGSRLDPLGMLGGQGVTSGRSGAPGGSLQAHDGSQVSMGVEIGEGTVITPKPMGVEIGEGTVITPKPMGVEIGEGRVIPPNDDEKPAPDGGDDVITGESIAAAIKTNDPGVYAQTTEDSGASSGNATSLAWAGAENDPRLTNYGPEGPQNVEVADNWAPPTDGIFDPPAEGASAGMVGAESATADPAAALGGSVIGSSTPDDFPPPPDPPPGDNPDDGPPDGGGGDEG